MMGLNVTAFSGLMITDVEVDEDGEVEDYRQYTTFVNNEDFPGRFEGLMGRVAYSWNCKTQILGTSCSWYCLWRDELAKLVPDDPTAFAEQIDFSDCEGTLGPVVCKKLAQDYDQYTHLAEQVTWYRFTETYEAFRKAFKLAANNSLGAVVFS